MKFMNPKQGEPIVKKRILFAMLVLVIVLTSSAVLVSAQQTTRLTPLPASSSYQASAEELALSNVYQRVSQSVVNIIVLSGSSGGTGSGFVIDANGHIVTNNHVVEGARMVRVNFNDGTSAAAEVIGTDPDSDLAVIRVDPAEARLLQPVTFADSEGVFVGQNVMAIGSPFGQDFTLTTGIVSALDRSLSAQNNFSIPEVIQTDAAINPGNSGGPLLNMNGEVIGVNTAILSRSNTNSGVGFSVPSNQVRRVVPYLIQNGAYQHSWLGISGSDVQPAQLNTMKLATDLRGVMIAGVTPNGPAASAGLRGATQAIDLDFGQLPLNGDIITAINGVPLGQMSDLISYLSSATLPGDTVSVTVVRDGQQLDVPVTLQARP